MTVPGPTYPDQYPVYTLIANNIVEIFDGEAWRAVVRDGTALPHFANFVPEGTPHLSDTEPQLGLVAEIAGQGNSDWISIWFQLPPIRLLPPVTIP